jgi:rhodanese-related sulfurtransferase
MNMRIEMKKTIIAGLLGLSLIATGAVASETETMTPEMMVKKRVADARANTTGIDNTTLRQWIDEGEKDFILLDVREPGEVTAGKIEADEYMAVPRGLVEFQVTKKVKDLDMPLVVYCLKGGRGALVAETLVKLGYTNVYNLSNGIHGWIQEGHPVSNFFGEFEVDNFDSNFAKKG